MNYQQTVVIPQQQAAEAAQKAQEAAQAQAAQLAAQQAQAAYTAPPAPVAPSGDCQTWMAQAGISDMANAYKVIMFESGCRPGVMNAEGACGIPQALPCSKLPGYPNDPVAQLRWAQDYVYARYGSWANAWQHELDWHWY